MSSKKIIVRIYPQDSNGCNNGGIESNTNEGTDNNIIITSSPYAPSSDPSCCSLENCALCNSEDLPASVLFVGRSLTWSGILWVVFWCLHENEPNRTFFSLKEDVYPFVWIPAHWEKLCITQQMGSRVDSATVVKKKIQDALSHNRKLFTSGASKYRQNGFWKLRERYANPWKTASPLSDELNVVSKKRQREEFEVECEDDEEAAVDIVEQDYRELKVIFTSKLNKMREEVSALRDELSRPPGPQNIPPPKLNVHELAFSFEYMRDEIHERIDKLRNDLQKRDDDFNMHAGNIMTDSNELLQHMINIKNMMNRYFPAQQNSKFIQFK